MADNALTLLIVCPCCGKGNYQSQRALFLHHLNSCRTLFEPLTNTGNGCKRSTPHNPTIAQRAEHILKLMKRPHTSGTQHNVNHLSCNHSFAAASSTPSDNQSNNSTDLLDDDPFPNHTEFSPDECNNDKNDSNQPGIGIQVNEQSTEYIIQTQHPSSARSEVLHSPTAHYFISPWC